MSLLMLLLLLLLLPPLPGPLHTSLLPLSMMEEGKSGAGRARVVCVCGCGCGDAGFENDDDEWGASSVSIMASGWGEEEELLCFLLRWRRMVEKTGDRETKRLYLGGLIACL